MGMVEGVVQTIDGSGYAFGSVDGLARVQSAAADLAKKPNDPGLQAAYNAAYWNAVATETALIPGVGAVYASIAFKADLENITINKINPLSPEGASTYVGLMGNFAIMLSQGVTLGAVLAGGTLELAIGGTTFAASELVDFASAVLTGAGVYLDKSTIGNYLAQGAKAVGINQNADGTYNVVGNGNSSLNIVFSGGTFQSTFTMTTLDIQAGNTVYVPTADANGNITGFTPQVPHDVQEYGNGTSGANFTGSHVNTDVAGVPISSAGASPPGIWTLDNVGGTTKDLTLVQYSDGSFGTLSGSPGNCTVDMKNVGTPPPGQSNDISMTDDNGQISASVSGVGATLDASGMAVNLGDGASATLNGSRDTISAGNNDSVSVNGSSNSMSVTGTGNTVTETGNSNSVSSSLADNDFSLTGTGNRLQGAGVTALPSANSVSETVKGTADGGVTEVVQYADGTASEIAYDADGAITAYRPALPAGVTVGPDQFYVDDVASNLDTISSITGVSVSTLMGLNPGFGITSGTQTISTGQIINLPASTSTLSISVNPSPQPQTQTQNEDQLAQNTSAGYISNSAISSIGYSDNTLNNTDFVSTTEAGLASSGVRQRAVQTDPNGRPNTYLSQFCVDPATTGEPASNPINAATLNGRAAMATVNTYVDPILLDLTGNDVHMKAIRNGVLIDTNNSGTLKRTGWADTTTGMLVVDDGSGQITNMSQMFPEFFGGQAATNGSPYQTPFRDGIAALASLFRIERNLALGA